MSEANIKMRRIAFVSDAIYPYNRGGKETRLFQISTRLAVLGYDVHIYTMQWWKGSKEKLENGVHLHAICPLLPLYDGPRRSIKQGILFGLSCFQLLSANFEVIDVDHMPFFPLYSMRIVCWLKGKKMTATWHEVWGKKYWKEYLPGIKGDIASAIESWSFTLPDRIIAVSAMTANRVKQAGFHGEIITIPNGIDLEAIKNVKPSKITSDVIFAGRLLTHKHVDILIDAIALLKVKNPIIKCVIIGDGPALEHLKILTGTHNLEKNIHFYPFQKDITPTYEMMKSSKVFVLPSTREGFGLVVLEANACGLPVITIDHPDNAAKDLIGKENGRTIPLSAKQIAISIQSLLEKKVEYTKIEILKELNWSIIVQKLVSVW